MSTESNTQNNRDIISAYIKLINDFYLKLKSSIFHENVFLVSFLNLKEPSIIQMHMVRFKNIKNKKFVSINIVRNCYAIYKFIKMSNL